MKSVVCETCGHLLRKSAATVIYSVKYVPFVEELFEKRVDAKSHYYCPEHKPPYDLVCDYTGQTFDLLVPKGYIGSGRGA